MCVPSNQWVLHHNPYLVWNINYHVVKSFTSCIYRANNQTIAARYSRKVKVINSKSIRGHRTQPHPMMAIQIIQKPERGTDILSLNGNHLC